jgi:hypothetical protein
MDVYKRLAIELAKRDRKGWKSYGKPMTKFDGRDTFLDMYEELLDLVVYFTKLKMEEELLGCSSCRKLKRINICLKHTNISASGATKKRSLKTI